MKKPYLLAKQRLASKVLGLRQLYQELGAPLMQGTT